MPTAATFPNIRPTLLLDFANAGRLSPLVTFTRASNATYFDETGILRTAANNTPRFDYNPATLAAQGLLIEEQRTNSIRNNTMQGAVAGTPGTAPTNWGLSTTGATTYEVVGTGTESGITYIDIRFQGTGAADTWNLIYDLSIVAANGQSWTGSTYLKLAAGSTSNLPFIQRMVFRNSGFTNVQSLDSSALTPTSAGLATQRLTLSLTATQATTALVTYQLNSGTPTGAYDITLRIGLPQLELGAFATSVIPTTTTALTRSADVASVNTLSPWFNVTEGSFYTEWIVSALGIDNNIATLSDGTSNNRHQNYIFGSSVLVRTAAGGVASSNSNGTAVANAIGKFAFGYGSGTTASSFNGSAVVTTTQAIPSSINILYLGLSSIGTGQKQIWLRRYTFYPRKLANAELQAITA